MSAWDHIKDALVEAEEKPKPKPHAATLVNTTGTALDPHSWASSSSSAALIATPIDPGLLANLKSRVYPNSGALSPFLATFNSLTAAIPDESTRLTAAISVCSAQGGSIAKILADIDIANSRLVAEKQTFETERVNKLKTDVTSRENRLSALTQEISTRTAERDQLAKETESLKADIDQKTRNYTAALGQIAADLDAMERKLKGAK